MSGKKLSTFTEGTENVRIWIITTNNILQITRKITFLSSNTLTTRNGIISKKVKTCKGIIRVNKYVSVKENLIRIKMCNAIL